MTPTQYSSSLSNKELQLSNLWIGLWFGGRVIYSYRDQWIGVGKQLWFVSTPSTRIYKFAKGHLASGHMNTSILYSIHISQDFIYINLYLSKFSTYDITLLNTKVLHCQCLRILRIQREQYLLILGRPCRMNNNKLEQCSFN